MIENRLDAGAERRTLYLAADLQPGRVCGLLVLAAGAALAAAAGMAQRPDPGPSPRPDPAREAALKQVIPLTTGVREDDHPAAAARNGRVWAAWVSYSETEGTSHIYARSLGAETEQVTEAAGDYHKPAVAIDESGVVWVVWPAQVGGNWDLYARPRRASGWGKTQRWTTDPAPDIAPRLASSGGRMMLVWQSMRRGNLDILFRVSTGGVWSAEAFLTESAANDWSPALAAGPNGEFHAAWDSYRGDYDVFARSYAAGRWGPEIAVTDSPRLENRPALAVDARGRLWIAWETGPERWASDSANGGLHQRRTLGLACLDNGKLLRAPSADAEGLEAPALSFGRDGRLRLFFRQVMTPPTGAANWLTVGMTQWDSGGWTPPETLVHSEGRVDQSIALAEAGEQIVLVYPAGSSHNVIYAKVLDAGRPGAAAPLPELVAATAAGKAPPAAPKPHTLNGFELLWGDLHRHTDISEDGGVVDGSLTDAMRYALDAASLDFLGISDHTRYLPRRYNLWRIQQIADLYHKPGVFVPMFAYERSQNSPWGHRNVVHLARDFVPVPASYDFGDPGVSPFGLFAALRGKNAISIPHTSAWANKQVSWDYNDPQIEPLVEIYQGLRSTYEYNGAPDPAGRAVYETDSKNFVWDALARKLKLGFIASSDHRSTHMSFAAVYARGKDRQSIFDALRARRTYASTDRILVDFSIGRHMMGETMAAPVSAPDLEVAVEGTADLAQIDIIKNNRFVYTVRPSTRAARFTFRDQQYQGEECYYYVRVIQADKHMAWASPIWVQGRK